MLVLLLVVVLVVVLVMTAPKRSFRALLLNPSDLQVLSCTASTFYLVAFGLVGCAPFERCTPVETSEFAAKDTLFSLKNEKLSF